MTDFVTGAQQRPLHVLMTADAVGGVWTYALTLASVLRNARVRFTLAVMGPLPSDVEVRRAEALLNVTVNARGYRLEWMPDAGGDVEAAGRWLLRLAGRIEPDVVHINGYAHASVAFERPVLTVAHSCVRSWWRAVKQEPAPVDWDDYSRRVRAGLAASTLIVAPTRAMGAALQQEYGFEGEVVVVPNGLPLPAKHADVHTSAKEPFIFTAGRFWDEAKNLAMLDEVAPQLPWLVVAAGSLDAPDGATREPRNVRHVGQLDRAALGKWMARAAIYAHPARYEPFGLCVLEAAQAGCALVLGDIPSLREIWHEAALYVDPHDRASLRDTLARLIADDELRGELGRAARARASSFSDNRMGHAYLAMYRKLTAGSWVTSSDMKAAPCA